MRSSVAIAVAAAATGAAAARPANTSICDYYTGALLGKNTPETQGTVLTLLVNTVVIGNYTKPTIPGVTFPSVYVPGILKKGTVNGETVDLLPYFDGGLASSNRGSPAAVNFLDDGGATPLLMNKPANGTSSNQYRLLTHLYQYFGMLLGCSAQANGTAFPQYMGDASMFQVHKYMDLSYAEVTYFIEQVGLAAESFGVASDDITAVANALNSTFNYKCAAPAKVIPYQGAQLQSICVDTDCPLAANASTSSCPYAMPMEPAVANASLADGEGTTSAAATATPMATSTGSGPASSVSAAGAGTMVGSVAAGVLAAFAFLM